MIEATNIYTDTKSDLPIFYPEPVNTYQTVEVSTKNQENAIHLNESLQRNVINSLTKVTSILYTSAANFLAGCSNEEISRLTRINNSTHPCITLDNSLIRIHLSSCAPNIFSYPASELVSKTEVPLMLNSNAFKALTHPVFKNVLFSQYDNYKDALFFNVEKSTFQNLIYFVENNKVSRLESAKDSLYSKKRGKNIWKFQELGFHNIEHLTESLSALNRINTGFTNFLSGGTIGKYAQDLYANAFNLHFGNTPQLLYYFGNKLNERGHFNSISNGTLEG